MNILFLHGLESHLSSDKKQILEKYGNVIAPVMEYHSNPNTIEALYKEYLNQKINVIIGSSMGGFTGFYLSKLLNTPALLFNPALPYRSSVVQNIPAGRHEHHRLIQIVIGGQDDVILAKDNLEYLMKLMPIKHDLRIHLVTEMAHRIPIAVFESEVDLFFKP